QQRPDGTWAIYYDGPGDLHATVEAYFALKLAGVSLDEPFMAAARRFILAKGGVPRVRIFTKIWLALCGQYPWGGLPAMPPELILLPSSFPFNVYEFACWARGSIVPMFILLTRKPVRPVPSWAAIDELFPGGRQNAGLSLPRPRNPLGWKGFFYLMDKALHLYERLPAKPGRAVAERLAAEWIVSRQEADGSWGGIQPPWVYSLMALKTLGYAASHPVIARGLAEMEQGAFALEGEETFTPQACLSPVWDTALAIIGLLDAGLPPDHPALVRAGRWLLKEQILAGGDWQVKNRRGRPGGWAFEFHNDIYPDTDDASEVMMALHRTRLPEAEAKERALRRGLQWLLSMQSRNGGWGSFDVDNTRGYMAQIPFADFGAALDPPTEDVTAHIVEMLGILGFDASFPPLARALAYLRRTQEADGAWWGRWGVNYIYGTGAVLPALRAVGEGMSQEHVRRAVRWLEAHQNADGGWGESCASYADPTLRGQGASTASQTAWALLALLAAGDVDSEATRRGIAYLVQTQRDDGTWDEPYYTATGFPRDFYINYHLYRHYWPLMALGRYRAQQPA
ncbi:MAG: squalene--hopene cyclase, partial [Dehalococcoidia bacterium]